MPIDTPLTGDGPRLPVLVWIHGGAYVTGAGDAEIYDPHTLVDEQHIIVVSVTYRLGVLGYLVSQQIDTLAAAFGGGDGGSGRGGPAGAVPGVAEQLHRMPPRRPGTLPRRGRVHRVIG